MGGELLRCTGSCMEAEDEDLKQKVATHGWSCCLWRSSED